MSWAGVVGSVKSSQVRHRDPGRHRVYRGDSATVHEGQRRPPHLPGNDRARPRAEKAPARAATSHGHGAEPECLAAPSAPFLSDAHRQLLELLDGLFADGADWASRAAADHWVDIFSREGHPRNADLPDANLLWAQRGFLGDLGSETEPLTALDIGCVLGRNSRSTSGSSTSEAIEMS
jgi:hypothetical protein